MKKPAKSFILPKNQVIATQLTEEQFNKFVLPHLSVGKRGPRNKISLHAIFNYILYLMHTGMQWANLPIALNASCKKEIHYTRLFKIYQRWVLDGSLNKIFQNTVELLFANNLLDASCVVTVLDIIGINISRVKKL